MRATMVGRLEDCWLLAYAADPAAVAPLLPKGLEPVAHGGEAYWNVVASLVGKMRPKGTPRLLGNTYVHVAYRIYAKARTTRGDVEGLFFVRSDVDDPLVALGGNVATDFRFHASRVQWASIDDALAVEIESKDGAGDARFRVREDPAAPMPPPFLKYNPLGVSVKGDRLRLAEVRRDEAGWRESPARVEHARFALFERVGQSPRLVAATRVAPLDYEWRLGGSARLASGRGR